jgi:hypothetical protein
MTQTNNPTSAASVGWSNPGQVAVQDDVCAESIGADSPGNGLVIDFGAFPTTAATTVAFAIASAWTDSAINSATFNCWISPDGSTKIGSPTSISLPSQGYAHGTQANRISPTALSGSLTGLQAASAAYLIIEQQTATFVTNVDFVQLTATWTPIADTCQGITSFLPPYSTTGV